jgi:hypothetical protein
MDGIRNMYNTLVSKKLKKELFRRYMNRWKDNIKNGFKEIGWGGVDWIHMVKMGISGGFL